MEPVVGADGVTVDLNVTSSITDYLGEKEYGKVESKISQPVFHVSQTSSAATIQSSDWMLLGLHSPGSASNRKVPLDQKNRVVALLRGNVLIARPETAERLQAGGPALISSIAEYVEVGDADAADLLSRYNGSNSAKKLREDLDALEQNGRARLLETACITTRSGQRAKVQSVGEWVYPIEMDPPEIPHELTGPIAKGVDLVTPLSFTAFDTRNIGTTLEIDPVASHDRSIIDINVVPEIVSYFGDSKHGKAASEARMPIIATLNLSTAATIPNGDTVLVGVHTPLDEKTKKPHPDKRGFLLMTARCLEL